MHHIMHVLDAPEYERGGCWLVNCLELFSSGIDDPILSERLKVTVQVIESKEGVKDEISQGREQAE